MSQISSLVLLMMMAINMLVMMLMIIMMVMLIMIMIRIMNVEFIWLTSLNAIQIKVSSALAYNFNFNQLRKAVGALPRRFRPLPCPANILAMTRPALPFPIHSCFVLAPVQNINRVSYEFPIKRRCFCATV